MLQSLGIDGAVLEIDLGEVSPEPVPAQLGPTARTLTPQQDSVRLLHRTLTRSGLEKNLLHACLDESAAFTDRDFQRDFIAQGAALGRLSRQLAVHGVVLETPATGFSFDYRWDGYDLAATPGVSIASDAAECGRRFVQALMRENPDAVLYLLTPAPWETGALWFAFTGGMLSALQAVPDQQLHLIFWRDRPEWPVMEWHYALYRMLDLHWLPYAGEAWRDHASLNLAVAASAGHGTDALIEAMLFSDTVVWLDAAQAGNWPLGDGVPGMPRTLRFAWRDYARVGLGRWAGNTAWRLANGDRQALLFWMGTAQDLSFPGQLTPLQQRWVRDELPPVYLTGEREIAVPATPEAFLLTGMPAAALGPEGTIALSAPDGVLGGGVQRQAIEIALSNPTDKSMSGQMQFEIPKSMSIGAASMAYALKGAAHARWTRYVQGRTQLGQEEAIHVTLAGMDGSKSTYSQSFTVAPARRWSVPLDGPALGMAAWHDEAGKDSFVLASEAGDVHWVSHTGKAQSAQRMQTRWRTAPAVCADEAGRPWVVIGDHRGNLWWMDELKIFPYRYPTGELPAGNPVHVWKDAAGATHVWAATADGRLLDFDGPARLKWELSFDAAITLPVFGDPAAGPPNLYGMPLAVTDSVSSVLLLNAAGDTLWEQVLPARLCGPPVIAKGLSRGGYNLCVPLEGGRVHLLDLESGARIRELRAPVSSEIAGLARAGLSGQSGPEWLVWSAEELVGVNGSFQPVWRLDMAGITAVHVVRHPFPEFVAVQAGLLHGITPAGAQRWQDGAAIGAITAFQAPSATENSRSYDMLLGDGRRGVHALRVDMGR
ncbi:MAG: PQQ-like beta-propeller repeat protein [Candidatus Hydrogenedentes bacterium]|nr:PQQ-like beta-propeller repeat protein [Candidatus Hydrogenedentota bacterium]